MNEIEFRRKMLLSVQGAFLGEMGPKLRAVTCGWGPELKNLMVVAIFDGEISEEDLESISCVETELISDFYDIYEIDINSIRVDFPKPLNSYVLNGGWVYRRRE